MRKMKVQRGKVTEEELELGLGAQRALPAGAQLSCAKLPGLLSSGKKDAYLQSD